MNLLAEVILQTFNFEFLYNETIVSVLKWCKNYHPLSFLGVFWDTDYRVFPLTRVQCLQLRQSHYTKPDQMFKIVSKISVKFKVECIVPYITTKTPIGFWVDLALKTLPDSGSVFYYILSIFCMCEFYSHMLKSLCCFGYCDCLV